MGFKTFEEMSGWHEFRDGRNVTGRQPFAFRLTWGPDSLRRWLDPRRDEFLWQECSGEVDVGGMGQHLPCKGTLELEYFKARRIRYCFDFSADGMAYRYVGTKENLRWWNLPVTHTTCSGTIVELASGRLVSTSTVLFAMRDLPRLLRARPGLQNAL